ncbi:MAG: efflux RND transporter periplasmic adaptor subunit, partial [Clostridia bacterium]|nr:efflux RND transporter periplasmic adaptor subunit [Clostridia bacterium]
VKKGDPIMRISNDEIALQTEKTQLEWEIACNDLETLSTPLSEDDFERQIAELDVEQCKITLENKESQKDNLILKAPFDGTIIDYELTEGESVNSGTLVATFATSDKMEVIADFSERDLNSISKSMEVRVYVKGLDDYCKGTVEEISFDSYLKSDDNDRTTSTGTFEVIISITNSNLALRPGMQTYNTVIMGRDDDGKVISFRSADGYIRYCQTEELKTEVSGTIAEILSQEGQKVNEGTPLLSITNAEIDRQVKEAKVQLEKAEEDLALLLSPEENTIKSQELKVAQAHQDVLTISEQLDSLTVLAPIDGIVANIAIDPGDAITSQQELAVISNFSENYMEISVDELDINKLKFGQEATIEIDALPDTFLKGKVTGIAYEGDSSNGVTTYPVTLKTNTAEGIKAGMTATATILLEKKADVLRIPAEALLSSNGKTMVRMMKDDELQMKPIIIGINNGLWVEVIKGLEEGEKIVAATTTSSESQMKIMPGMGGMGGMGGYDRTKQRPNKSK